MQQLPDPRLKLISHRTGRPPLMPRWRSAGQTIVCPTGEVLAGLVGPDAPQRRITSWELTGRGGSSFTWSMGLSVDMAFSPRDPDQVHPTLYLSPPSPTAKILDGSFVTTRLAAFEGMTCGFERET